MRGASDRASAPSHRGSRPRLGESASHASASIASRPAVRAARDSHRGRVVAGASASGNRTNTFVYDTAAANKPPLDIPHWHSRALVKGGRMFTETFPVRFDECGPNKQSTMRTVASMIQECACNHAQGIWGRAQSMPADMNKANLAWVCTRLHIDVLQYPLWGDQVEVRTWFEAQGRIAARRDWEMSDVTDGSSEKVIARATSSWIAFNLEKRKLARIPQSVLDEFQTQALPDTLVMGDAYEVEKLPDVRGMPGVTLPESHSVRRTDLDMNNHVNNVVYTEWLLESVPDAFWEKYDLREIILEFRNECHDGDNVDAICCRECGEEGVLNCEEKPGQATLVHMLLKRGFGMSPKEAEVVRARSVWRVKK
jgi:fatty acyl-ACP thioesterase A